MYHVRLINALWRNSELTSHSNRKPLQGVTNRCRIRSRWSHNPHAEGLSPLFVPEIYQKRRNCKLCHSHLKRLVISTCSFSSTFSKLCLPAMTFTWLGPLVQQWAAVMTLNFLREKRNSSIKEQCKPVLSKKQRCLYLIEDDSATEMKAVRGLEAYLVRNAIGLDFIPSNNLLINLRQMLQFLPIDF